MDYKKRSFWIGVLTFLTILPTAGVTPAFATTTSFEIEELGKTGHFYQLVESSQNIGWESARTEAEASSFQGMPGHLVSVTSQEENDFVRNLANGRTVWLGGKILRAQGIYPHSYQSWTWSGGPEDGVSFSVCADDSAQTCISTYANWDKTGNTLQPDLFWGEDALSMIGNDTSTKTPGAWHDCYSYNNCGVKSFVIEYEENIFPTSNATEHIGFTGYQGRTEAQLAIFEDKLVVNGVGGNGRINFLNLETLEVEKSIEVGEYGNHFLYPLISGSDLFLSNSFGSHGTFLRKFDKTTQTFGEQIVVCQNAGYDKGIAKNGKLYIPCTDRLVVVSPETMQIEKTFQFQGHAVQPAVFQNNLWVPIHDGQILKFDLNTGQQLGSLDGCYSSQSIHIINNFLICTELGRISTYSLNGSLLGQTWLPGDGLGSYYRSEDSSGIWICNMSIGLISHFNPTLKAIDKIYRTSSYTTGSATLNSALFVATGNGDVTRFGKYLKRFNASTSVSITGTPSPGRVLKASIENLDSGASKLYQWFRDTAAIQGANNSAYSVTNADVNAEISVQVSTTKIGYEKGIFVSSPAQVSAREFMRIPVPQILGRPNAFSTLSVPKSAWGTQTNLVFSWLRDGVKVLEEHNGKYPLAISDVGSKISVQVCGSRTGYITKCLDSLSTPEIDLAQFGKRPKPTLSFNLAKGVGQMSVRSEVWPSSVQVSYIWYVNGRRLDSVNSNSVQLSEIADAKTVQVIVVASSSGYKTIEQTTNVVNLNY